MTDDTGQRMTIDQAVQLLELTPPSDLREIQLARRNLAKRWHPDRAAPAQRGVHERQMKVVNAAADLLEMRAEQDGPITAMHVKVSADVRRRQEAEAGERAYAEAQAQPSSRRAGTQAERSVVYRYVRSATYPEWGVGSITDISFTGTGDEVQQWARVEFSTGNFTLPYDNLIFVDFAKRERDAERAARFLTAAKDAVAKSDAALAIRRLIYARNGDPDNPEILELLARQFLAADQLKEAGRAVRDWIRADPGDPDAHLLAEAIYSAMGAHDLAAEEARRAAEAKRRVPRAPEGPASLPRKRARRPRRKRAA